MNAPEFDRHGGSVSVGVGVKADIPGGIFAPRGDIYITADGADPRMADGSPNPAALKLAFGDTFQVQVSGAMKSRQLFDHDWSALTEAYFIIGTPADSSNLEITEIHYDPVDGKDYEFIEVHNRSDQRIDLRGLSFSNGIDFALPQNQPHYLEAGAYGVIVANREAFTGHYTSLNGAAIIGEFASETNLKNDGERLALLDRSGGSVWSICCDNTSPRPELLEGHSLVLRGKDSSLAEAWFASAQQGGSPGGAEDTASDPGVSYASWMEGQFDVNDLADIEISGSDANPDNDAWPNFADYALGLDPKKADHSPLLWIDADVIRYQHAPGALQISVAIEVSAGLVVWEEAKLPVLSETFSESGATAVVQVSLSDAVAGMKYVRLRITMEGE